MNQPVKLPVAEDQIARLTVLPQGNHVFLHGIGARCRAGELPVFIKYAVSVKHQIVRVIERSGGIGSGNVHPEGAFEPGAVDKAQNQKKRQRKGGHSAEQPPVIHLDFIRIEIRRAACRGSGYSRDG
ncbi:hypothetical protein SDC9_92996 [bioreactor metagenome]|uniref:Uncharacterized protein n=1 Tax=bioreactor metagenome TaxID=1076179 RepID=A0A645A0M9_9ZZZZ